MNSTTQVQKTSVLTYERVFCLVFQKILSIFSIMNLKNGIEEKLTLPQPKTENRCGFVACD